jgi:uncharacterized coiled-coil protein SlyX
VKNLQTTIASQQDQITKQQQQIVAREEQVSRLKAQLQAQKLAIKPTNGNQPMLLPSLVRGCPFIY